MSWIPMTLAMAGLSPTPGVVAQARASSVSPGPAVERGVRVRGWRARFDETNAAADLLYFRPMGTGVHLTTARAAVVWKPGVNAAGKYKVGALFSSQASPDTSGAIGLFVGGSGLDRERPRYTAFLARSDGKYRIERHSPMSKVLVDWTGAAALMEPDAQGVLYNQLSITVDGDLVHFMANDREVVSLPRSEVDVKGSVGLRAEDRADVHVTGFAVQKVR